MTKVENSVLLYKDQSLIMDTKINSVYGSAEMKLTDAVLHIHHLLSLSSATQSNRINENPPES